MASTISGAVHYALSGATVSVDFIGSTGVPERLFTGRVDRPGIDLDTGIVTLACHDDLRNRVAALDRTVIDGLTAAGYYSISVQGEVDDRWAYAQARMETICGDLDCSVFGVPRVTLWEGLPVYAELDHDADLLTGSLKIRPPERAGIRNRVRLTLQYRYTRLRDRRHALGWWYPHWSSQAAQAAGWDYPSGDTVASAAGGSGWTVLKQTLIPAPAQVSAIIGPDTYYLDIEPDRISGYSAVVAQRHAQTITEEHEIDVRLPRSIETNGELAADLSFSAASEWDAQGWESDFSAHPQIAQGEIDYAPDLPRHGTPATLPADGYLAFTELAGGPWASPVVADSCGDTAPPITVRDTFANVSRAALAVARKTLLETHRSGAVDFALPIRPDLDTSQRLRVTRGADTWEGKVARVVHVIDPDAGTAITEITLAQLGVGGVGIVSATPLDPPAQPANSIPPHGWKGAFQPLNTYIGGADVYAENLNGWLTNPPETISMYHIVDGNKVGATIENAAYTPAGLPETGFKFAAPGVSECNRNEAVLTRRSSYDIDLDDDPFSITLT